MDKGQPMGVQKHAGRDIAGQFSQAFSGPGAVRFVARNGKPDVLAMNPNLVGSAGVKGELQKCGVVQFFRHAITGPGVAPFTRACGHALAV